MDLFQSDWMASTLGSIFKKFVPNMLEIFNILVSLYLEFFYNEHHRDVGFFDESRTFVVVVVQWRMLRFLHHEE